MALIEVSSSISTLNPSSFLTDGFELSSQAIIPSEEYSGSFIEGENNVEFFIYNSQTRVEYADYNFTNYKIVNNSNPNSEGTNMINLSPERDVLDKGYSNGKLTAFYNFVNNELSSSIDNTYFISEISSDRTEIKINSNFISNNDIQSSFIKFQQQLQTAEYFDEFYISFGNNENHIGINTKIEIDIKDAERAPTSIFIKLYDALPLKYKVSDQLYVFTKTAESLAYQIEFEESFTLPDTNIQLKGPNTNLNIQDFTNGDSVYKNKNQLIETKSSSSKDELVNVLNRKGIHLTPNYSSASFNEFVNFSSAKARVNNFVTKVTNIQTYENDIRLLSATTGSNSTAVSSSISSLWTKIEEEIKNFDGFEYYQYYNTGSDTYPKTGDVYPFELLDVDNTEVKTWLGSDNSLNQYYGGMIYSASIYDENNENWLYYTIPAFITEQNNNDNYIEFCNLVGQSFDELWLYTKAVTNKLNTTNQLDKGVPLSLADDVITSLGYTGFGNNYNNQDNFIGLVGNDNGSYVPPTGSEYITNYIAINKGTITNYWQDNYSWEDYVEQLITAGFPYPVDRVSKEIFKRLYHNMAYLVKKKGTIAGLRQLINIWGIPSTILRISEFGGKNKDETDDYDLWYQRYSYAYTPVANSYRASASAIVPWMPLERNYIAETEYIVPDGVGFRFKTTGFPSSSYAGDGFASQSLAVKKSNGTNDDEFDWSIALFYTGSTSGSYSGATNSDYVDYGEMRLIMSASVEDGGTIISDPIYLPFFDKGWWTVLLQRDNHSNANNSITNYTLFVKNKLYDGWDGNSIGFEGSTTISNFDPGQGGLYGTDVYQTALYGGYISESVNHGWNKYGTDGTVDGVYIGGRLNGSRVGEPGFTTNEAGFGFSGSFQEFRYYSNAISESVFNDTVMNPESIEGNSITGSLSSFDIVNFRAPLGNELESFFTASSLTQHEEVISSSHPAITASAPEYITGSFINPADGGITSSYFIRYEDNQVKRTYSKQNVETYFLDQPSIGIRNRISNKIQATSNLNFGTALSDVVSIQKDPFISQSYTENINTLEVAFSPQNEINDDIIQTLGYGAIQSAIADPRFRSQSSLTYPELDKISDDYFRKYVGSDVFDYLRLIKYFDDSLFKAIKNYVPARTSVSTGIVIKQNMLERNRYREPQVDMVTTQSYAIQNIPLTTKNLLLTGSIETVDIEGGAGGSVNEYNTLSSQSGVFVATGTNTFIPAGDTRNLCNGSFVSYTEIGDLYTQNNNDFSDSTVNTRVLKSKKPIKAHISLYGVGNFASSFQLIVSSSLRGELARSPLGVGLAPPIYVTPLIDILPEESIAFFADNNNNISSIMFTSLICKTYEYTNPGLTTDFSQMDISSSINPSSQAYIENNITSLGVISDVINFQEEFYDGEYSGSALETLLTQSNPYNKVLPSETLSSTQPTIDFNFAHDMNNVGQVTATSENSFDFNTLVNNTNNFFTEITDFTIIPFQTYEISYDVYIGFQNIGGTGVGLSPIIGYGANSIYFYGNSAENYAGSQNGSFDAIINGTPTPGGAYLTNFGNNAVTFSFMFTPPEITPGNNSAAVKNNDLWNNTHYSYSLMMFIEAGLVGNLTNFNIKGVGGIYEETQALIPWDLNVINNYNPLTSGSFNIYNTQSIIFETSDYNPLNNNVTESRPNKRHYVLDFYNDPYPENRQTIIDVTYNPFSASSPILVAEFSSVPESNYTALSHLNPTYRGTKISSLTYNTYTPSGSVRPINQLKAQPYNKGRVGVSSSVAVEFLDGTTGSWEGDTSYGKKSVIDQHPQYIARFDRSFEQFNIYDSREFTISSLISISMDPENIKTIKKPESIDIEGSNANKKPVSTTFSPNRKMAVSFDSVDSLNTKFVDLETVQVGDYDLLGGSIQFLTINSNAKSKNQSSTAYWYTKGDQQLGQVIPFEGNVTGSITNKFDPSNPSAGGIILSSSLGTVSGPFLLPLDQSGNVISGKGSGGECQFTVDSAGSVNSIILYNDNSINYQPGDRVTIIQNNINVFPDHNGFVGDVQFQLPEINVQYVNTTYIPQNTNTVQMVTASQVTPQGQQYGFLLSGSDTTGSEGTYLVPFSQNLPKSGFSGLPDSSKLSIGGPQLAVYHTYNQLVASASTQPPLECSTVSRSYAWVLDGLSPSNPDNYYQWAPSSSDCGFYEDNKQSYLIERGDVLRVEGIKSLLTGVSQLTSSIEFQEDFIVEEIQNYFYTSSTFADGPGTLITGTGFIINNVVFDSFATPTIGMLITGHSAPRIRSIGGPGSGGTEFTTNGSGVGGTIQVTSFNEKTTNASIDFSSFTISAQGTGYAVGDIITIPASFFNAANNFNMGLGAGISLTLTNFNVITAGQGNPFTVESAYNFGCGPGNPGNETPYRTHPKGQIGLNLPTFIKTDRNPSDVLLGVNAGEITKFTIRRQIENEKKVMTKNTKTTLGSQGYLTQTGGGFLLPSDLSETQKQNALNTINELRSKNAFPGSNNQKSTDSTTKND
jgi:hypothetical protein